MCPGSEDREIPLSQDLDHLKSTESKVLHSSTLKSGFDDCSQHLSHVARHPRRRIHSPVQPTTTGQAGHRLRNPKIVWTVNSDQMDHTLKQKRRPM